MLLDRRAGGGEGRAERRLGAQDRRWRILTPFVSRFNYTPPSGLAVTCHPLLGVPLTPRARLGAPQHPGSPPLAPIPGPGTLYSLARPVPLLVRPHASVDRHRDALHLPSLSTNQ